MPAARRLEAVLGDITTQDVEAVVNAANEALAPGAGVCGAIFRAAGFDELEAACRAIGRCPTGEVRVTPGFALAARWIIHAVGPVWHGGSSGEDELLRACYFNSLAAAESVGAASVAFPAISTGIYGFPADRAATICVDAVRTSEAAVDLVRLVAFDEPTFECYRRLLER